MLNFLKKKFKQGKKAIFKIEGMHCTSCSMNIDGELEDLDGVFEAKTSYAKAQTVVYYDPQIIKPKKIQQVLEKMDYEVSLVE